jgi:hypothetical protein
MFSFPPSLWFHDHQVGVSIVPSSFVSEGARLKRITAYRRRRAARVGAGSGSDPVGTIGVIGGAKDLHGAESFVHGSRLGSLQARESWEQGIVSVAVPARSIASAALASLLSRCFRGTNRPIFRGGLEAIVRE